MSTVASSPEELLVENAELRAQLAEATDILAAIRCGEVDAVLAQGLQGEQLFTLKGADDPYRVLIEEMNQGAVTLSANGTILYCNRRFSELLKTPLEKIIGHDFAVFVAPDERAAFATLVQKSGTQASSGEITLQAKDRGVVPLQLALSPLPKESAAAVCLIATDISESRAKEADLRQATAELAGVNADLNRQMEITVRERFATQQVLDNSMDVMCSFDLEGRFVQVSRACETVWGYQPEELIGQPYLAMIVPEDRERSIAAALGIMAGTALNYFENRYLRRDGSEAPILWTASWSEARQLMFCVARDITERKQIEEELLHAKNAAEAASAAKSEFLANMSHEIRTPMNGIIGMTDLALETDLNADQRNYLGMVKTSAHALLGLINDILDFSKIEAGKLELEAIPFSLRDCIGGLLKPLTIRAEQKGLELSSDIPDDLADHLTGDPLRLRQILINLTDNAIKFTDAGSVKLSVTAETGADLEHYLHFTVADTGAGIPAAKQAVIFDAFAQADGSTTRTHGGTGLGLAIASQLVQKMGGRMWVESVEGAGTTFHFTTLLLIAISGSAPADPAVQSPVVVRAANGLRILLAEDNVINSALATGILEKRGHSMFVAGNGLEAVAAAAAEAFDLILMDVQMPEMDGFDATRCIRESELLSGRRTPIAAMTAHAMAGDRERCLAAGMDDYLSKPLNKIELLALIERITSAAPGPATHDGIPSNVALANL